MDWNEIFEVKNHSGMIIIAGVLEIYDNTTEIVEPTRHPETTIEALKVFEKRGNITVSNKLTKNKPSSKTDIGVALKTQTIANEAGDKHDHFIYDPSQGESKGAISVQPIDLGGSSIEVDEDLTSGNDGAIVVREQKIVAEEQMSKEDATKILGLQWKKFESEINKTEDLRKLNFLQVVAIEINATDKKKEIIQNRISSL